MRKRISKKTATSRTAQLEEKIEDLVSMLRATHDQGTRPSQSNPSMLSTSSPSYTSRLDSLAAAATADPSRQNIKEKSAIGDNYHYLGLTSNAPTSRGSTCLRDLDKRPEPTSQEAEAYLAKFRNWLHGAPFMHIPIELTAETLKHEKPFLWICIMNLCSMSYPQQRILREKVRQEIAERVVLNHERSMDLLQGLIAFITWATMNTGPGMKPFVLLYAALAQSIAFDMGLTRSPFEDQQSTMYFKIWSTRTPPPPKVRTMEERRAILGLWLTISITTGFIGKMETLAWTPHMEECLQVLERQNEAKTDIVLVTMVRIQLIGEEVQKLTREKPMDPGEIPAYIFKPGLISRLDDIRVRLPDHLAKNIHILMLLHSTEALVHSIGIFTSQGIPESLRINSLYSCARSAKVFYDAFFTLPPIQVAGLPFAAYVSMSHVQATLYRLTIVEDPAWDKEIMRSTVDLLYLLDKTIELFYQADEVYPIRTDDQDGTLFTKGAKILRNLRNSWEPVLAPYLRDASLPTPNSQGAIVNNGPQTMDATAGLVMGDGVTGDPGAGLDLTDVTWMSDIFGPWEY
ncbi:hypothetical protein QQS21_008140 [Conoideocrella luteorostrata]|uniref:Transcription factor domain-containing protein n=1 Tax=Conoideocrella luteorostrata TaxID=1105319 RepID=A0AAJ0CNR9_9HYPO|nr:hypothetical protein QQS21_008140 [Conoideocrella luteorostrata]